MSTIEKALLYVLVAYVFVAVIIFGHAAVRQDKLATGYYTECRATGRTDCYYFDSGVQAVQAALWPFYLSYIAWGGK
jgi:hypothetical protein